MNSHLGHIGGDTPNTAAGDPWSKYIKRNAETVVVSFLLTLFLAGLNSIQYAR